MGFTTQPSFKGSALRYVAVAISQGPSMNSAILIVAFFSGCVLVFVFFRLDRALGQTSAAAGQGRRPKVPRDWRRWLFGEHNIPFN
jgi:ABC-type Fe3+ transport system permease subunit